MIDASAVLEILLCTERAHSLMIRAFDPAQRLHAPELLDVEVTQVLRRMVQRKEISVARAGHALEDLAAFPLERHRHLDLVARIWELRDTLTAYDGTYVALSEGLGAPLLTCDAKLARAGGHRALIELEPIQ